MTTNLFVIANVKQLRTDGSFRILLPFFRTYWGVGVLNSANFSIFHNRVEFGTILEGLRNFRGRGGGEAEPPNPPVRHCVYSAQCVVSLLYAPLGYLMITRLIFAEYNQENATFHHLFMSVRRSTCFRRVFCPSSGAQNCTYSARYWSDKYPALYVQF